MRKEVLALLKTSEIEFRVISLLRTLGMIDRGDRFSNIKLSVKGKELLKFETVEVSDEFIEELREIFPIGDRGSRPDLKARVQRFLSENKKFKEEHILKAARKWIRDKGEYAGYLTYFFYKKVDGFEQSRCLEYCEALTSSASSKEDPTLL